MVELEEWEKNLVMEVDCYLGKGKVHLYESDKLIVNPSQFDKDLQDCYDVIKSY